MAFVVFTDGKTTTLKAEQALAVWDILQGRTEPENDKQSIFCDKIKRLYLNRENAPQDYLDMYPKGYDVPSSYASALGIRNAT